MTLTIGSLFAGIGGFDLGFERAGFTTRWACEIDQKAQAVLRLRFPGAALHDDVCKVGRHNLETVDVVTFGSPCQDLSVAGKRAGLAGERSGLFHEAARIIRELRERDGKPDFAIWENVPGAFSSNGGRDFAAVVQAMVDLGARDVAWRVLDSRYFGVAQRRRRVFLVADFGGERAEQVLALAEGVRGDSAPRRQAWKGTPRGAASGAGGSGLSRPIAVASGQANAEICGDGSAPTLTRLQDTPYVAHCVDVAGTLCALDGPNGVSDQYANEGKLVAIAMRDTANTLDASCYKGTGTRHGNEREFVAICATGQRTHALTSEEHDASEDGMGRGTPVVAHGFYANNGSHGMGDTREITPALMVHKDVAASIPQPIAFNWQEGPTGSLGIDPAGGSPPAQASQTLAVLQSAPDVSGTLGGGSGQRGWSNDLDRSGAFIPVGSIVRRLTPTECCRLQGFPDDWNTEGITRDGKRIAMADSSRYKQLGNAVTVNVALWLAKRIAAVYAAEHGQPEASEDGQGHRAASAGAA